jgi:hypothetical protein
MHYATLLSLYTESDAQLCKEMLPTTLLHSGLSKTARTVLSTFICGNPDESLLLFKITHFRYNLPILYNSPSDK